MRPLRREQRLFSGFPDGRGFARIVTNMDLLNPQLPGEIAALRDEALALHGGPKPDIPECLESDANAWREHTADEPWLIWKARQFAARMEAIPVNLSPGERIVGKIPEHRELSEEEEKRLEECRKTLADMPPHPGGDRGHFHPDFQKILDVGVCGLIAEIQERAGASDLTDEQHVFYRACGICMDGFVRSIERHAKACAEMADTDPGDAVRWKELGALLQRLTTNPPSTFHEAVQLMHLVIFAVWYGEDHSQTSCGRMDRTLRRFYENDRSAGVLTDQEALDLISCLYIQQNRLHWPGGAVAVIVGGVDGATAEDVTNELSYLCLSARLATRLVYPTVGIAWHPGIPDELMDFGVRMLAKGTGDPSFFNDQLIAEGLQTHGASKEDSRNWMNSTCVEVKVAGASNIWVTAPYISCPEALLEVMRQEAEGGPPSTTYDEFERRVKDALAKRVCEAAEQNEKRWQERTRTGCQPFASCVTNDCLALGKDFDRGGARYHWVENSWVGLANLVDGLFAIKTLVFDGEGYPQPSFDQPTIPEFYDALRNDYEGYDALRNFIENNLPKYGMDQPEVDEIACDFTTFLMDATEANEIGGHRYVPGFFCWIQHEKIGSQTMATPDGRKAGLPLADGAGAGQGRERLGPTAGVLSTTKWDHRRVLGGLVHNMKFARDFLDSPRNCDALRALIETYMRRGGFETQINVVDNADLRDAQEHPDKYRDLLVRVAGYSDYFVHLNRKMQDEIIQRSEFDSV